MYTDQKNIVYQNISKFYSFLFGKLKNYSRHIDCILVYRIYAYNIQKIHTVSNKWITIFLTRAYYV